MKIKTKNAKIGVTSTVSLALHKDLMLTTQSEKSKKRWKLIEVKKVTYGETL